MFWSLGSYNLVLRDTPTYRGFPLYLSFPFPNFTLSKFYPILDTPQLVFPFTGFPLYLIFPVLIPLYICFLLYTFSRLLAEPNKISQFYIIYKIGSHEKSM